MTGPETLLTATKRLWDLSPALSDFAPWPDNLVDAHMPPAHVPAANQVARWQPPETGPEAELHSALAHCADQLHWKQTYTVDDVGQTFLDNYGYIELIGPEGHFISNESRIFLGYWGKNLDYDWHSHEAEELYYILSGCARFRAKGQTDQTLKRSQTQTHTSFQPHAMQTTDQPLLALIPWRGPGLGVLPEMVNDDG